MHPFFSEKLSALTSIKKILLIGAGGITGRSYAGLLIKHGYVVYVYDASPEKYLELISKQKEYDHSYIVVSPENINSDLLLKEVDAITLTPGVPLSLPIFHRYESHGIPIFSEIEYCRPLLKESILIGVTGTNGKSSVVSMLEHTLKEDALACGNIGIPLSEVLLEDKKYKILIVELSSYQLELFRCEGFDIVIYLNIAEDHLNRYKGMNAYYQAKWNIAAVNLSENQILLYGSSLLCVDFLEKLKISPDVVKNVISNISSKTLYKVPILEELHLSSLNFFFADYNGSLNGLFFSDLSKDIGLLLDFTEMKLKGIHNQYNILFVVESLYYLCHVFCLFSEKTLYKKIQRLTSFLPLSHRFELFYQAEDCTYIDDSKATTIDSVIKALSSLLKKNIFLFLGGRGKDLSYDLLVSYIKNYNKSCYTIYPILFGEERIKLQKVFQSISISSLIVHKNLCDVFKLAKSFQVGNEIEKAVFLLSPGCTSWDAYSSFEERGRHFQDIVQNHHRGIKI